MHYRRRVSYQVLLRRLLGLQLSPLFLALHHIVQNISDRNDSDGFVIVFIVHHEDTVHSAGDELVVDLLNDWVLYDLLSSSQQANSLANTVAFKDSNGR